MPRLRSQNHSRILARQAKRAKAQLPTVTQAVRGLADDFGKALGVSFEGEEGEEFIPVVYIIQTVFYGLFAGWTLWLRSESKSPFRWEDLADNLKIPFLAELYYEFQHPRRIQELRAASAP